MRKELLGENKMTKEDKHTNMYLTCSKCGRIHITKGALVEQLVQKLRDTATEDQLYKVSNIFLKTKHSTATHYTGDCPEGLKIIKTIRSSKRLTGEEKQDIIRRITRMSEDPKERKRCHFMDLETLDAVFAWIETKEGHNYWEFIDRRLSAE